MKIATLLCLVMMTGGCTASKEDHHRDEDLLPIYRILIAADQAIAKYPVRRFTQHFNMKFMHGDDTSHCVYHVTLQRDTAGSFGYKLRGYRQYEDGKPGHFMYDGEEAIFGNPDDTLMSRFPASENPEIVIEGYCGDARFPHVAGIRSFSPFIIQNKVTGMSMRDSIWHGEPVYVIEIRKDGDEEIAKRNIRITVRKRDSIPVRITEDMDLNDAGGMLRQHRDTWIENLELNPEIPQDYFSRRSLPDHVLIEDYSREEEKKKIKSLLAGTAAPDFILPVYKGDSIRLSDLTGKVVFIDFWYKSCHPCRLAAPKIEEMYHDYGEDGNVVFLGLNPYDDADDPHLQQFIDSRKIQYPILLDADAVSDTYKVTGFPTFFIIDREGFIRWSSIGYAEGYEKTFREELEKVLDR